MYATGNSEPRHGIFFSNRFVTQLYVRKWKLGTKSEFPVFHEVKVPWNIYIPQRPLCDLEFLGLDAW